MCLIYYSILFVINEVTNDITLSIKTKTHYMPGLTIQIKDFVNLRIGYDHVKKSGQC